MDSPVTPQRRPSGLAWLILFAAGIAAGWMLCTVWIMKDCETLGAFRIGEVAYQCDRQGRGW